jgi:hypothetical protein
VIASYDMDLANQFNNIIKIDDQYFVKVEQPELINLENGQLRCVIEYSLLDNHFSDGTYDASD